MFVLSLLSTTARKLPLSVSKIGPYEFQVRLFLKTIVCKVCTKTLSFSQASQQQLAFHIFHLQAQFTPH